jgi:cyclopropane-fatty-acyl-phospholipid synthase
MNRTRLDGVVTSRVTAAGAITSGTIPSVTTVTTGKTSVLAAIARKGLLAKLGGLTNGRIELHENGRCHRFGQVSEGFPEPVRVWVHADDFFADIAFGGSIGAGESFMAGLWDCDNLVDLMRIMTVNRRVLDSLDGGSAWLTKPLHRLFHLLHRNTVSGSRKNIQAHYDLGNDFFRLFLDDTLMYSSAIFPREGMSLKEGSIAKLERICQQLELCSDDHVLEIGTGWGGFAIHAASRYGCRVTTTTISDAQYQLAQQRVREAGLEHKITVLKEDFRNLQGQFDKLVSVEMIEAIGEANIGRFFDVCNRRLKAGGRMLLQAITIRDQIFDQYRKAVDFIQRFIFPGGFLPSTTLLSQQMGRHSSLRVQQVEDFGHDYARTLAEWRHNFDANAQAIEALGYSREFMRLWLFYFCYCEAGFSERATGVVQMLLVKDELF